MRSKTNIISSQQSFDESCKNVMKRLALDTSILPNSIAVQNENDMPFIKILTEKKSSAENIVCEIGELMKKAQLSFADLDQIVTTRGPGSFMGLRIGMAAMRGIALAAHLPIKSISTLALIASFVKTKPPKTILVCRPAQKGICVFQIFNYLFQPVTEMKTSTVKEFQNYHKKQKNVIFSPEKFSHPAAVQLFIFPQKMMEKTSELIYLPICS